MNTQATPRPEFNTNQYVWAHGKAPRGRGSWAFQASSTYRAADVYGEVVWVQGTYAEAKRQAVPLLTAANGRRPEFVEVLT